LEKELIIGIIYSKFDQIDGPVAVLWLPESLSQEILDTISLKTINMITEQKKDIDKSLAVVPFSTFNLKGLVGISAIKDASKRGGVVDFSITLLFDEKNDVIFYKYLKYLENYFFELIDRIIEAESQKSGLKRIKKLLTDFNIEMKNLLRDLRQEEINTIDAVAFPSDDTSSLSLSKLKFKMIVIGDPCVGKTSTILQFTDKAFRRSYIPTIGVNITEKKIMVDDTLIELVIWDVAGQSKFQKMRKHYYKGARAYFLVFDLTDPQSYKNISAWNNDVKKYISEDIPDIILANKSDLKKSRYILIRDLKKLAIDLGLEYLKTSAKTGKNIDEAFLKLGKAILNSRNKPT
jgi:small GTP-binding protein